MAVASGVTAPAPVALPESIGPADRVAAVFRLPDPPATARYSEPWPKLLGWVIAAAGLLSLFIAKTADV